jgi:hypothetical protein
MITINDYTGNWQAACRPAVPRRNSMVRIHDEPDAREYDDFMRCLRSNQLTTSFEYYMPRKKMNVWKIVKVT